MVAPIYTDIEDREVKGTRIFTQGFDWEKINQNVTDATIIHSDKDPYISQEHFLELEQLLDCYKTLLKDRNHFGHPGDSQKQFRELLDLFAGQDPNSNKGK